MKFGVTEVLESSVYESVFKVDCNRLSTGFVFAEMERLREDGVVDSFEVSWVTLEEIFNMFA